jgi:hypothetical protein
MAVISPASAWGLLGTLPSGDGVIGERHVALGARDTCRAVATLFRCEIAVHRGYAAARSGRAVRCGLTRVWPDLGLGGIHGSG